MFVSPTVTSVGSKPCILPVADISGICKLSSYLSGFRCGVEQPNFTHMRREKESNWHSSEPCNFGDIIWTACLYNVIIRVLFSQV
jgi:hypothetical protein